MKKAQRQTPHVERKPFFTYTPSEYLKRFQAQESHTAMQCEFPPEIILPEFPERRLFHDSSAAFYDALERHTVRVAKQEPPTPPKKAFQKYMSIQTAPLPQPPAQTLSQAPLAARTT